MSHTELAPQLARRIELAERDAWVDLYRAAPEPQRASLGIECAPLADGAVLILRKMDHIQFNRIAALGIAAPAEAQALQAGLAAFAAAGVKDWIVHAPPVAEGLAQLCQAQGLTPHPRSWAKFICDGEPREVGTELQIREIGAEHAAAFGRVAIAGFGMPPFLIEWIAALPGRAGWRCFMAFERDAPVATGALYVGGTVGWLGLGATLPEHRRRGAQSALLAARIAAGRAVGCVLFTTETGIPHPGEAGPSFKNIQSAGFRIAYERPNYRRA